MVLVKKWPFFHVFFLGNIGQEKVFYNLLERKNAFLAYKNNTFKKSKNWIFPKGLTHSFGQNMAIFPCLFFRQYRPGKCVLQYSRTKKRLFQPIKTTGLKSRKIEIFAKGLTHSFGEKMVIFPYLFFRQYRPGKFVLQSSRRKKRLSRL